LRIHKRKKGAIMANEPISLTWIGIIIGIAVCAIRGEGIIAGGIVGGCIGYVSGSLFEKIGSA